MADDGVVVRMVDQQDGGKCRGGIINIDSLGGGGRMRGRLWERREKEGGGFSNM